MPPKFFHGAQCALLALLCSVALAQSPKILQRPTRASVRVPDNVPKPDIRVDSTLIQIPVQVTTALGTPIANLDRATFHLYEDGVEQEITHFVQEDSPISIGLLFDSSGSMTKKMQRSSEAAAAFFKTANSEDEFFLVDFNDRAKLTVPFTPDSESLYQHIVHIKPFGRTSLLDAIHLAMRQMKYARHPRKALVILSDGGDNSSRYTGTEIRNAMLEGDVQLYAMGIFDHSTDVRKLPVEEQNGPRLLDELSEKTGGRAYVVENLEELPAISTRIANELRSQYMVGYSSSNSARDGKYRRVKITLTPPPDLPELKTYYRQGYAAPSN